MFPKPTVTQGQLNKELEKSIVHKLSEIYPGTQVKVKNLSMYYEKLDPPALDVVVKVALEIKVIPGYEEFVPEEEETPD